MNPLPPFGISKKYSHTIQKWGILQNLKIISHDYGIFKNNKIKKKIKNFQLTL